MTSVVVNVNGRERVIHHVEPIGETWKERFQWLYGFWPEDDRLIRWLEDDES